MKRNEANEHKKIHCEMGAVSGRRKNRTVDLGLSCSSNPLALRATGQEVYTAPAEHPACRSRELLGKVLHRDIAQEWFVDQGVRSGCH